MPRSADRLLTGELVIEGVGELVGKIPVRLSYRIIELFSGHLYSNPAKAIEELVANSYDAFAGTCRVIVPDDWQAPDSRVLVWDDGESMDIEGLKELWLVAESTKRDRTHEEYAARRGRLPIGKFGIGKLASYVLGERITHICRRGDEILAVSMDFSKVVPGEDESHSVTAETTPTDLLVKRVTTEEVRKMLGRAARCRRARSEIGSR